MVRGGEWRPPWLGQRLPWPIRIFLFHGGTPTHPSKTPRLNTWSSHISFWLPVPAARPSCLCPSLQKTSCTYTKKCPFLPPSLLLPSPYTHKTYTHMSVVCIFP